MYITKVKISNRDKEGLLSGKDHLNNYLEGLAKKKFHFDSLYSSLKGDLYLLSYYKNSQEEAIRIMNRELGSHSLKGELGKWERVDAKKFKEMFGWS